MLLSVANIQQHSDTPGEHDNAESARHSAKHHLDASELTYAVGRELQAMALAMRQHRPVPALQLCTCGRLNLRVLPIFGLRCEIASAQWDRTHAMVRRLLEQIDRESPRDARAVGRASVHHRSP